MPRRGVLSASRSPPAGAPGTGMAARRQAGNPLPPRARQSAQRRRMLRPDAAIPPMPPQLPKTISSVPDRSGLFISFPLLTVRQYVMGVRRRTPRMQSGFGSAQVRRPAKKPQSVSSAGLIIIPRREKCNGKGGESLITCAVGGPDAGLFTVC